MRFIPYYTVSYHGKFYRAGVEIEIDQRDADLMARHGRVVDEKPPENEESTQAVEPTIEPIKPVRKGGRPRKQQ